MQAPTLSKIAHALGRAPSELLAEEERLAPKAPRRSPSEPSFHDVLEQQRRSDHLKYLRAWRAFLGDRFIKWSQEAPPTPARIRDLMSAMNNLVEQGVFDTSGVTDESERREISLTMTLLKKLNELADAAEQDEAAEERHKVFELIEEQVAA